MLVVAVDPGVTCGVAVVEDGVVRETFSTLSPHQDLRDLLEGGGVEYTDVVVEKGPNFASHNRKAIEEVEELVKDAIDDIAKFHWMYPSQWKNTPWARHVDFSPGTLSHERDAARMGVVFCATTTARRTK